jgi:tetratricopeptide (TPR) repeat protein
MTNLERSLLAVSGYLTLGMHQDAWDELEDLPPGQRTDDRVLEFRIAIYQALEKWEPARILAESLAKRSPENPGWWLSWSYSLRREQTVEAARSVLREAVRIHPGVAMITYNLACYECVLGKTAEAQELLKRAISMDAQFKKIALADPDLDGIFGILKS